jgi:hypothetical protein
LRLSRGDGSVVIQFNAPCWYPGVGEGNARSSAIPFGLWRDAGMTFPGNGCAVSGSRMICAGPVIGFAVSSSPKSPLRIRSVGTVPVLVCSRPNFTHSSDQKKNSLLRPVLKRPGQVTGPLMENPG